MQEVYLNYLKEHLEEWMDDPVQFLILVNMLVNADLLSPEEFEERLQQFAEKQEEMPDLEEKLEEAEALLFYNVDASEYMELVDRKICNERVLRRISQDLRRIPALKKVSGKELNRDLDRFFSMLFSFVQSFTGQEILALSDMRTILAAVQESAVQKELVETLADIFIRDQKVFRTNQEYFVNACLMAAQELAWFASYRMMGGEAPYKSDGSLIRIGKLSADLVSEEGEAMMQEAIDILDVSEKLLDEYGEYLDLLLDAFDADIDDVLETKEVEMDPATIGSVMQEMKDHVISESREGDVQKAREKADLYYPSDADEEHKDKYLIKVLLLQRSIRIHDYRMDPLGILLASNTLDREIGRWAVELVLDAAGIPVDLDDEEDPEWQAEDVLQDLVMALMWYFYRTEDELPSDHQVRMMEELEALVKEKGNSLPFEEEAHSAQTEDNERLALQTLWFLTTLSDKEDNGFADKAKQIILSHYPQAADHSRWLAGISADPDEEEAEYLEQLEFELPSFLLGAIEDPQYVLPEHPLMMDYLLEKAQTEYGDEDDEDEMEEYIPELDEF